MKPKNRTTVAAMTPVQIALFDQDQEITTAEAVTTDALELEATSLRREANHRLLTTTTTTVAIQGAVQARPFRAAAHPDQEVAEAAVPAVEVPSGVEDDRLASASSYPNNNTRVSFWETRILKPRKNDKNQFLDISSHDFASDNPLV